MYDQLKRRYNCHRKKFPALFKIMLKKNKFNLKINWNKKCEVGKKTFDFMTLFKNFLNILKTTIPPPPYG